MKTVEERLDALERKYKSLAQSVLQLSKNGNVTTSTADLANNGVDALTPYTETKKAYVGDIELVFTDVPDGNLSVYVKDTEGNYPNYTVERLWDKVTVLFNPLEYVTDVTISVLK